MLPKILIPVSVALIVALGLMAWQIQQQASSTISDLAQRRLENRAAQEGNVIGAYVQSAISQSDAMADAVQGLIDNNKVVSRAALMAQVRGMTEGNESIFATTVIFEPNAYDGEDAMVLSVSSPIFAGGLFRGIVMVYLQLGEVIQQLKDIRVIRARWSVSTPATP